MRIVEPHQLTTKTETEKTSKKTTIWLFILPLVVGIFIATWIYAELTKSETNTSESSSQITLEESSNDTDTINLIKTSGPKVFSGNEFRLLYDNIVLPDTSKVDTPPIITGNDIADARMRQLAEIRGYKLRRVSSKDLQLRNGYLLHETVHSQWKKLQMSAADAGYSMQVVSAFRSVEDQRELFKARLQAEGISVIDIANGTADEEITNVLVTTAIPGYSKHHSGYTVDILCNGWQFEDFIDSPCYEWLSEDNYAKAKQFGFIPSYPKDADLQGPDPEAWEYVFVGVEILNR